MARESFDKEIQLLRLLALTSGAYTRQQLAERLGISVHTYDKTVKRLKTVGNAPAGPWTGEEERDLADLVRFRYADSADPLLLFIFRAKSLKESESERLALLLSALDGEALTAMELMDRCCAGLPDDQPLPDEKTIRGDLGYLEEVGVIAREGEGRPYRYRLRSDFVHELDDAELCALYDFVDVLTHTRVPSLPGYLLRESLRKQLQRRQQAHSAGPFVAAASSSGASSDPSSDERPRAGDEPAQTQQELSLDPFSYKYHFESRILDEAHLYTLLEAINARRRTRFLYYSPKSGKSYTSRNTNPLFEREAKGRTVHALPLVLVYDHQYGRWYMLAHERSGIRKYRIEGITQLELDEPSDPDVFDAQQSKLLSKLRTSWLIDTGAAVTVRARFYRPEGPADFIRERVVSQGQWGQIVEEEGDSFVFEIVVNDTTEIKPWLRSFGSSCEVLAPRKLRRELIEEWKEIRAYYESV